MTRQQIKAGRYHGTSIVDTMVALAIIAVAVIGNSRVRYCSALDSQRATVQVAAVRTAVLLCESWRGLNGSEDYDPTAYFGTELPMEKYKTIVSHSKDEGFTNLGSYKLTVDGRDYYVTLAWQDVATGLRALNAIVTWEEVEQAISTDDAGRNSFLFTTYAETTD